MQSFRSLLDEEKKLITRYHDLLFKNQGDVKTVGEMTELQYLSTKALPDIMEKMKRHPHFIHNASKSVH